LKKIILKNFFACLVILIIISSSIPSVAIGENKNTPDPKKMNIKNEYSDLIKTRPKFDLSNRDNNQLLKTISKPSNLFTGNIYTVCDGVEKTTQVSLGDHNNIDVDDDFNTGINGADIQVQYMLLPLIQFTDEIIIGLIFTISIERIGEEIKNSDFTAYAEIEFQGRTIQYGFSSPSNIGNAIPNSTSVSFMFLFYLTQGKRGFSFYIEPKYDGGNDGKILELFANYDSGIIKREYLIEFNPAIETQIDLISTNNEGQWEYFFTKHSSTDSRVTTTLTTVEENVKKDLTFIVDKLPSQYMFNLAITPFRNGGGYFLYESSNSYDLEFLLTSSQFGPCRYITIKNTPKRIIAEWLPTIQNGEYHLEIETVETDLIFQDDLNNPTINLNINNLGNIDFDIYWNLTNPGSFTLNRDIDLDIDLNFLIENWSIELQAKPNANKIDTKWLIDTTGYLLIDTDFESFAEMDLLIKDENLGLHTDGKTFKSQDWRIDWTLWPPIEWNLQTQGIIEFSSISIDLFLNGGWLHLWPW
jgi:hypothetical protein